MKGDKKFSLISSIVFFVIGIFIFLKPDIVVKSVSYGFGGLLILIGVYKTISYCIHKKRLGIVNKHEILFGVTAIVLGIIFLFLADAIVLLLRFIIGGWVILAGVSKIIQTFFTTDRTSKFYALIVVGVFLIGIGLYIMLVSNLALSIIGLFMMLYGIIDFISYFVYKPKKVENDYTDETDKKSIAIKEAKVIEVELEEK